MNTTENNKLIAEFLGMYEEDNQLILPVADDEYYIDLADEDTFKFDSDWNWLMGVVEKIESLDSKKYYVIIKHTQCKFANYYTEEIIANVIHTHNRMQSVYLACVEFIKWYNQQQDIENDKLIDRMEKASGWNNKQTN